MNALLIGATGATGRDLLELLLEDETFISVTIFVRRKLDIQHQKLTVHVIDFDKPEQWKHLVKGDVLFSCLGTTLKAAGSKQAQWKIDYDYQYQFAKAARENGVNSYVLVSSMYANPNSIFYYAKMKGELEVAVKALCFPSLSIFNPPALARKNSDRAGEVTALKVIGFFNSIGLFRSQKPLSTEVLAQAMINVAKADKPGIATYKRQEVWQYAGIEQ